jgi:hypothetical protein
MGDRMVYSAGAGGYVREGTYSAGAGGYVHAPAGSSTTPNLRRAWYEEPPLVVLAVVGAVVLAAAIACTVGLVIAASQV